MDEKLNKILEFLKNRFSEPIQTFNCSGVDEPYPIYEEDGISILYEECYDYIEIYGLTQEEYDKLFEISDGFLYE